MSDYYKSLITDEEVVRELVRESKRREGKLPTEATRLKPNLNFFERTVTNLVSNNTRIDQSQGVYKTEYYLKDGNFDIPKTIETNSEYPSDKSKIDHAFEREMVLKTKVNFIQPSETFSSTFSNKPKKKIEIKKISFISSGASTFNTAGKSSSTAATKNKPFGQKLGNSSCGSGDNESSNNSILSDEERKTTCETISTKPQKTKVQHATINQLNRGGVISISSDDSSIETISNDSEDEKVKNKIITKETKRKKKQLEEKLNIDDWKKSTKEEHKTMKKQKLDDG